METSLNCGCNCMTSSDLFLDTSEDNRIGINRHTNRKDNTCNTRKCQCNIKLIQNCNDKLCIQCKCNRCTDTKHTICNHKEDHDDDQTNTSCNQGSLKRVAT